MASYSLCLVTIGCLYLAAASASLSEAILVVDNRADYGFSNVDRPLSGQCRFLDRSLAATNDTKNAVFHIKEYSTLGCKFNGPFIDPSNVPGFVIEKSLTELNFTISPVELRVYTVWCEVENEKTSVSACYATVMYKLELTKIDGGFGCELTFGYRVTAEDFQRPDKVEWLNNGQPFDTPISKVLTADDFLDVKPGDYRLKQISFPLKFDSVNSTIAGEYECRYTVDSGSDNKQILYDKVRRPNAPIAENINFEPELEQYTDGNQVNISCAFLAYPEPDITWYINDELADLDADMTSNGNQFTSTILIKSLEDSKHRGIYKCVANNSLGEAELTKFLRARDKLAALWPFLGIVIQVILLAICIAVGEKCRKKKLAEKQRKRQLGEEDTTRR